LVNLYRQYEPYSVDLLFSRLIERHCRWSQTWYYPWRCLKRGFFLLITNKTPFLLTILQSTLLFLI